MKIPMTQLKTKTSMRALWKIKEELTLLLQLIQRILNGLIRQEP